MAEAPPGADSGAGPTPSSGDLTSGLAAAVAHLSRGLGWPLLLLTVAGALVRASYLGQPMRYDESYTYLNYAAQPWLVVISRYLDPNNHVFHNLMVHGATVVLGDAPWVIRLPAFVAGVLTVRPSCSWPGRSMTARRRSSRAH